MSQKTNPRAFRLVTTKNHLSKWCVKKQDYSSVIKEDFNIRLFISSLLSEAFILSKIEITRVFCNKNCEINVVVSSQLPRYKNLLKLFPDFFEDCDEEILDENKENFGDEMDHQSEEDNNEEKCVTPSMQAFLSLLSSQIASQYYAETNKILNVSFELFDNPFEDAMLIAKYISSQLELRIPFRRVMKTVFRKANASFIKGIKIELSGRLNGAEMARVVWKKEGKLPLHTLNAKIDYAKHEAKTVYGTMGVKVWLHKV